MLKLYLKRWIALLIIVISSLVIGIRTNLIFFHFFFWFLVSVIIINLSWIIALYFGAKLFLERKIITSVQEDDVLKIESVIKNNGFFPIFNIILEDNLICAGPKENKKRILIEYLRPDSSLELKYRCFCSARGKYKIGPFTVYFFDSFGLFFLKKTYHVYSDLYVYPHDFKINKFPDLVRGFSPWFGIQTTNVSGDEDEFFGIREYKGGDPISKIHWVSTARQNKLIVKQFQRQNFFRASIVFNLQKDKNFGEGKERVAEYTIKIAASVARYLLGRDIGTSVHGIVHGKEVANIAFNKGPEHLEDILRFLALAKAESSVSFGEIFEELSVSIPNDSTAIFIMTELDWEFLPLLLLLERRAITVIPLIIISSTFLNQTDRQSIIKETEMKVSPVANIKPIFFSQGDNLGECF